MMNSTTAELRPLQISDTDTENWSEQRPMLMKLAQFCAAHLPHGRRVPRYIGRRFGAGWRTTIRLPEGARLAVDPPHLETYVRIVRKGGWEPWVHKACLRALRPGEVFFDIGANAGCITIPVAQALPQVRVIAFEPQASLARCVAVSARLNQLDNVEVYTYALGEKQGTVDLYIPAHGVCASLIAGAKNSQSVPCAMTTVDAEIDAGRLPSPHVIKIDVEGAELQVLTGATRLIREHSPIIIFESKQHSSRFGYGHQDLLNWLTGHADYAFFRLSPSDVLACPRSRCDDFRPHYPEEV